MLETLDYTIRIGSTPTFLYFDLYLYSAYAAHFVCILLTLLSLIVSYSIYVFGQSSNLPQTAQTLDFLPMVTDFLPMATANSFNMVAHHKQLQKDYNIYNCHRVALLVRDLSPPSVANTACFESLCSLTFVSVSILTLALFCSTLPVTLLVVDWSLSQSFLLCFAQHLESLCSSTVSVPVKSPPPANIYRHQLPAPAPALSPAPLTRKSKYKKVGILPIRIV